MAKLDFSLFNDSFNEVLNSCNRLVLIFDAITKNVIYANDIISNGFKYDSQSILKEQINDVLPYTGNELEKIIYLCNQSKAFKDVRYNIFIKSFMEIEMRKFPFPDSNLIIAYIDLDTKNERLSLQNAKDVIEKELEIVQAFFYTYRRVYYIDLETDRYLLLTGDNIRSSNFNYDGYLNDKMFTDMVDLANDEYKDTIREFVDLSTIQERLKDKLKINEEFVNGIYGWCRIGLIVASRKLNGKVSKVLFTFRIINDSKQKEISMQNAVKEAFKQNEKANDIKTEFLSRMSHDIRTPLNNIIGMASLAKTNIDNQDKVASSLQKIIDSSNELTNLFSEVLDMSRIEAGNITLVKDEIYLPDLFSSVMHSNLEAINNHQHEVTFECSQIKHEYIYGDPNRLQQIFNNILVNAINYTPNKGKINIKIIENENNSDSIISKYQIIVSDNGIGMKKEFISQATQPFDRENRPQVASIEGAGLGLSIANSFAKKMGGELLIDSKENKGTTINVSFMAEIVDKEIKTYEHFDDTNILYISNSFIEKQDIAKTFEELGVSVTFTNSISSVIGLVDEADYSHIFVPYTEFDTIGLTSLKESKNLPTIIVTTYDGDSLKKEASNLGIQELVLLPLFKGRINSLFNHLDGLDDDNKQIYNYRKDKMFKGKKVLVVEDNKMNRELLREFLEIRGMDIYEAVDGKDAIVKFNESEEYFYDLVLMDLQMPVMNGYESTMGIRALEREDCKSIPIIAMTASTFADDINASLMAGMNEHIAKPLNFNTLHNTLEKWFNGDYASRKSLELKAETDTFTNVLNKVAAFERIHKYLSQDKVELSALMVVDLDNFKQVNDTYGHSEGDDLIKETTLIIKELFRGNDIIGRYGGDEFIIFMKDISNNKVALDRARTIVANIEKTFENRYSDLKLTASVGVALVNKPMNEENLFIVADQALYKAKNSGKNKISYIKAK